MYIFRKVMNSIESEEIGHNIAKAGSSKLRDVILEASRCEPFAYTSVHARVLQAHGNSRIRISLTNINLTKLF